MTDSNTITDQEIESACNFDPLFSMEVMEEIESNIKKAGWRRRLALVLLSKSSETLAEEMQMIYEENQNAYEEAKDGVLAFYTDVKSLEEMASVCCVRQMIASAHFLPEEKYKELVAQTHSIMEEHPEQGACHE